MSWEADADLSATDVQEVFAGSENLSYDDPAGAAILFDAAVSHERRERRKQRYGWDLVAVRDVYLLESAIPDGRKIRTDGSVTVDGRTYGIESIHPRIGSRLKLVITRSTSLERSRENYRG